MTTSIAKVINIARAAQLGSMTPEQLADDARREGLQRRARNLAIARPAIKTKAIVAIRDGHPLDTPPLRAVRRWMGGEVKTGDGTVLLLSGPKGSGKTCAAAWALAEHGGAFVAAMDLVHIFSDFNRTEWNRLCDARVLVVDDIGDEQHPDRFGPVLKQLLDRRAPHAGKLILPLNHDLKFLRARYPDGRLWSRMAESAEMVSQPGPDLRGGK